MGYAKVNYGAYLEHDFGSPLPSDHWGQVDVWIPASTFTVCPDGDAFGELAAPLNPGGIDFLYAEDNSYPSGAWRWATERAAGGAAATGPAPATTYTIKYHRHGTTIDWYVGGVLLFTDAVSGAAVSWIRLGSEASECCCEVYYFANLLVGTSDGSGDILADTFADLSAWKIGRPVVGGLATAVSSVGSGCPTLTATPPRAQAGTTINLHASGFAPDSPLTLMLKGRTVESFVAAADGSGDYVGSFVVPNVFGGDGELDLADAEANVACADFSVCGTRPSDGITTAPDPLLATGGVTNTTNAILDYVFHDGAHWVLWQDPSVQGPNLATFPPPANHTMNATRISADGSSVTDYPIDTGYQWIFDSGDESNAGILSQRFCGLSLVNAPVFDSKFFFANWAKPIYDARFASDGANLWVGIVTRETVVYPWLDNTDACATNPGSAAQFVPLATLTSGFTSFATSAGAGYQRFWTNTNGAVEFYQPNAFPVTDAGEENSGYWSPPVVVMFAFDGGAFNRIGEIEAKYAPGITNGVAYGTGEDGSTIDVPALAHKAPLGTLFSRVSMCASATDPGVCHVVWSEGGDWGRQGKAAIDCSRLVWDSGPENRDYRVNYTTWAPTAKLSDNDLFHSHIDRTNWQFPFDNGEGILGTGYTWPDPAGFAATRIHDIRNDDDAGTPLLFLSWETTLQNVTSPGGTGPSAPPATPADPHGNPWLDYGLFLSEDTLRVYGISGGVPTLLQQIGSPLLPTEEECNHYYPLSNINNVSPQASDALLGGYLGGAPASTAPTSAAPTDKAFGLSLIYEDPLLGGLPVYLVSVPWARAFGQTLGEFQGPAAAAMRGFYRVPADLSATFDILDGERQLDFSIIKLPIFQTGFTITDFGSSDFFSDPKNLWMSEAAAPGIGLSGSGNSFPGLWFDRVCLNLWEELGAAWTPNVSDYSLGAQCPGFYYDPVADSFTIVTAASAIEPDGGPLFAVVTQFICRGCNSCPCATGIHIAHRF